MSERVNFAERVRFANEIGRLKEENAKLRELVRKLSLLADYACDTMPSCDGCPMFADTVSCDLALIISRAYRLGVKK